MKDLFKDRFMDYLKNSNLLELGSAGVHLLDISIVIVSYPLLHLTRAST